MNDIKEESTIIENMIYKVRGKEVMFDFDLARLYECANGTKSINLAVKRHINRFPERFMFQLIESEFRNLRFQIETTNDSVSMSRSLPYAFTEQGVAMLSIVLRSEKLFSINKIEDSFIKNTLIEYVNKVIKQT